MIHPILWYLDDEKELPSWAVEGVRALQAAAASSESLARESALSYLDIAAQTLLDTLAGSDAWGDQREATELAEYIAEYREGDRA